MKKLMFTLAMFAVALTSANAQKQLGGEHNLEVSFNPFGGNPIDASVIKYRKFLDDDAALRVTLGLNQSSDKYLVVPTNSLRLPGTPLDDALTHDDLFLTNDFTSLNLGLGYEKHFKGTDNLSPYIAISAGYSANTIVLEREHHSALNIEDGSSVGSWQQELNSDEWGKWSYTNTVASNQMNFDLLFGADYYFNDAIYVGFEAGLRYARSLGVTSTITTDTPNPFNIYFDGGSGSGDVGDLVVNSASGQGGYTWSSNTPVNIEIVGEPWIGDGLASNALNGPSSQGAYIAADNLWHDWLEQSQETFDTAADPARDAFRAGANFLGTYSTGMLRIGYLFE